MLRKLLVGMALLCLAATGLYAYFFLDRPVRVIEVTGELAPGEAEEVRARISQSAPGRLLTTDLGGLRDEVLGLSWPRKVGIRRVWPDKISVHIERETVVAQWGDEGYLSPAGEVVRTPDPNLEVPYLRCAVTSPKEALQTYRHLQALLAGGLASGEGLAIKALTENALGEWRLELANGVQAALGAESLHERTHRFLLAYGQLAQQRDEPLRYLDLRYSHGVAARWQEEAAPVQAPSDAEDGLSGSVLLAER